MRLAAKLTKWRIDIKGAAGLFGVLGDEKKEDENEVRGVWDSQIQKPVEKVAEESLQSDTPQDDSTGDDDKKS